MKIVTVAVGPLATNCYLILSDKNNAAVIDPGFNAPLLLQHLHSLGARVQMILLTHGHYDHMGAVRQLQQETGARLVAGKKELPMLRDAKMSLAREVFDDPEYVLAPDVLLEEGESVQLDELTFTCIETPGHTEGGVTYRVGGALFTGDTLFKESAGRTDLYGGDYGKLKASLAKLAALEGDFAVYPGHGDATTLEYERQTNSYIGLQDYDTYF